MAKKKNVPNWDELKIEYATTDISYHGMAKKYGIPFTTIRCQGKSQNWVEARTKHREEVVSKSIGLVTKEKVNKLAGLQKSADKMSDVIQRVMDDSEQFFRRMDVNTGEEVLGKKVDYKAMRDLTAAMKDLTAVLRNLWDIPTEAESLSMQIARERLEIERKKAEVEEEMVSNGGIVLIPTVIEEGEENETE